MRDSDTFSQIVYVDYAIQIAPYCLTHCVFFGVAVSQNAAQLCYPASICFTVKLDRCFSAITCGTVCPLHILFDT